MGFHQELFIVILSIIKVEKKICYIGGGSITPWKEKKDKKKNKYRENRIR